jgi:hypothetical protein
MKTKTIAADGLTTSHKLVFRDLYGKRCVCQITSVRKGRGLVSGRSVVTVTFQLSGFETSVIFWPRDRAEIHVEWA